jgi:hypothetical protein
MSIADEVEIIDSGGEIEPESAEEEAVLAEMMRLIKASPQGLTAHEIKAGLVVDGRQYSITAIHNTARMLTFVHRDKIGYNQNRYVWKAKA